MTKKGTQADDDDPVNMALRELMKRAAGNRTMDSVQIVKTIVDAFSKDLFLSQRVLLRSIFGEPLDAEERALMDRWVAEKKTNWKDPEVVGAAVNERRRLRGLKPIDHWIYQFITIQAGMRCLVGSTQVVDQNMGHVRLDELIPEAPEGDELQTPLHEVYVQTQHGFRHAPVGLSRPAAVTVRIETEDGATLEGLGDHPVLSASPGGPTWRALSELRVGDRVARQAYVDGPVGYVPIVDVSAGLAPTYDLCVPAGSEYVANGFIVHNSSKSSVVALLLVIKFFKLITAKNPQDDYGLTNSSVIYLTALASTERQTLGTIFAYVKNYILGSSFFKRLIDAGELFVTELDVKFPSKHIVLASGHSKAESIVGRTALTAAFDELAMFSNDEASTDSHAKDVYTRVGKSTMTFREHGQVIALSSVKCIGDFMEELVRDDWDRQAEGCLVFDLSTFDMNPTLDREDAGIAGAYKKDPAAAERDFENIRPAPAAAFLNPHHITEGCRDRDPDLPAGYRERDASQYISYCPVPSFRVLGAADVHERGEYPPLVTMRPENDDREYREHRALEVYAVKDIEMGYESVGHCDPGLIHDSFGFACGHSEWTPLGNAAIIDIVLEWMPEDLTRGNVAKVDWPNVEEVLYKVAKARRISDLTFDHWQGESHIQNLYNKGVVTHTMHYGGKIQTLMYDCLKQKLSMGLVKFPNHPGLLEELMSLELRNGQRIDHPRNKPSTLPGKKKVSKDLADCVACCVWKLSQQGREHELDNPVPQRPGMAKPVIKTVGVSRAASLMNQHRHRR